jgi:3-polyprenyl-4-hydroxybenzoate decarboxylase
MDTAVKPRAAKKPAAKDSQDLRAWIAQFDPSDMDKVVWAMCTRFDSREGMETLRGCWSTALDPMAYGADDPRNARVVIDACRPFKRRDTFPVVVRASEAVEDLVRRKFGDVLPKG